MTTSELLSKPDIYVYAVLYVKHVRQHGFNRSFYVFLQRNYRPTEKDKKQARLFDIYLREKHLIVRTGRQTYEWNRVYNIILMKEIVNFLDSL